MAVARLRRSCLAVPGSSPKMLAKAAGLAADQVFLDLEDAVAPLEKNDATVTYKRADRVLAVATIGRDRVSLAAEAAMERGEVAAGELR